MARYWQAGRMKDYGKYVTQNRLLIKYGSKDHLGSLNASTPPDLCSDQKCEYICYDEERIQRWADAASSQSIASGSMQEQKLGVGTMQKYWNASYDGTRKGHCVAPTLKNFTTDIHTAVCNENIKIFDPLYSITWFDGPWDTLHQFNSVHANNSFTRCNSVNNLALPSITSPAGGPSSTTENLPASTTNKPMAAGTIVVIVMGSTGVLVASAVAGWIFIRQKLRKSESSGEEGSMSNTPYFPPQSHRPPEKLSTTAGTNSSARTSSPVLSSFASQEDGPSTAGKRRGGHVTATHTRSGSNERLLIGSHSERNSSTEIPSRYPEAPESSPPPYAQ
ncbi:hypothetical protein C8R43DRAFT_1162763 [Mycena crocata]|nr:hypothetical protein C8R43DRAFT_1162763 [Mycena crocata]